MEAKAQEIKVFIFLEYRQWLQIKKKKPRHYQKKGNLWISAISRDDLSQQILMNDRVCGRHFVSGKVAKSWDRFNTD